MLPLSGSEKVFKKEPWKKYKKSNNCYAYAVNDLRTYRTSKSVPGDRTQGGSLSHSYTHCTGIDKKILEDNPGKIYKVKAETPCKKGYYKIMMFVAPENRYGDWSGDFHFYKQHGLVEYTLQPGDTYASVARMFEVPYSRIQRAKRIGKNTIRFKFNGFSHKMGWATEPLLKNSCGKIIKDPRKACKKYGYNYKTYCSSFCVKDKGVKVGSTDTKIRKNSLKTL
jgi:hypothetical protein